jgi:hypothetical protein
LKETFDSKLQQLDAANGHTHTHVKFSIQWLIPSEHVPEFCATVPPHTIYFSGDEQTIPYPSKPQIWWSLFLPPPQVETFSQKYFIPISQMLPLFQSCETNYP